MFGFSRAFVCVKYMCARLQMSVMGHMRLIWMTELYDAHGSSLYSHG